MIVVDVARPREKLGVVVNRRCLAPVALIAAVVAVINRLLLRPWHERWGATDEEVEAGLPGDELVADPALQITRAVTIDAPPEQVWPWIVQLGADRGGFYSYDWLENLFGLRIHNADRIVPEWQTTAVGDLVTAEFTGSSGWYVMDLRPNDVLVLKLANVDAERPVERDEGMRWEFVWIFAVRPGPGGTTRLLIRERTGFDSIFTRWLMAPVGPISFVMTRRTLLGIKSRAEGARAAA